MVRALCRHLHVTCLPPGGGLAHFRSLTVLDLTLDATTLRAVRSGGNGGGSGGPLGQLAGLPQLCSLKLTAAADVQALGFRPPPVLLETLACLPRLGQTPSLPTSNGHCSRDTFIRT